MAAQEIVGPAVLFVLMVIVGLDLTLDDFRRVAKAPRAVVGGTLAQLVLLPLLAGVVVLSLDVPPVFTAGAILVAVSPGAGLSNVLAAVAGLNTALSVTLTAVASVLSVVTLPTFAAAGMGLILDETAEIRVPVGALIAQLTFSLLVPIAVGMTVRSRWPEFVARHGRKIQRLGIAVIAALIVLAIALSDDSSNVTLDQVRSGFVAAAVWTLAAMALGWGVASLLRLSQVDRFTFLIEFSARNIGVAAIVGLSGLGRVDLTYFSAAYGAVGYPLVILAALWQRRRLAARRAESTA